MAKDWTYRQLAAEFIATLLFVWAGCGAAISSNRWTEGASLFDPGALVAIALAFGITISVLAYGIGHISGGHMNPAVTLAFMLLRLQSITAGLLYMVAQCLGAIFGALILWGCNASLTANCNELDVAGLQSRQSGVCKASYISEGVYGPPFGLGANTVGPMVASGCAFLLELMGTYLLVFTVLHAAVHSKSTGGNAIPIAIGWSILVCHLILVPYTGCGINPARSLGPMVVDSMGGLNKWTRGWWVFYTAPFVGSMLATATYKFILAKGDDDDDDDDGAKAKKDDDLVVADVEDQIPPVYDADAKNTGEEAQTDDAVPHTYE